MDRIKFDAFGPFKHTFMIEPEYSKHTPDGDGVFVHITNDYGNGNAFLSGDQARQVRDGLIERYGVPVDDAENDEEPLAAWERELLYGWEREKFEKGDTVLVSTNPGTKPEPRSGYVAPEFAGITATVVDGADAEGCYPVEGERNSPPFVQWIHPAHLTKVDEPEPEPKRFEPGDRVRLTGPHYIADGETDHTYDEAPNGEGSTGVVRCMEHTFGADASVSVSWDGGRSSVVATSSLSPVETSTAVFDQDGDVWVETGEDVFQMVNPLDAGLGTAKETLETIEEDYGIDNGLLPVGARVKVTHAAHVIEEGGEPRIATIKEHVWSPFSTGTHPYLVEFEGGGNAYARDVEPYSRADEEADKMREAMKKAAEDIRLMSERVASPRYFLDRATSPAAYSWSPEAKPALKEGDVVKVIDDRGHMSARVGTFGKVESVAVNGGSSGRSLLSVRIFGGAPVVMFEERFRAAPDYCTICKGEGCTVPGGPLRA